MKKKAFYTIGLVLVFCGICVAIVSCNKEKYHHDIQPEISKDYSSRIDFNTYYATSKELAVDFWAACDRAYGLDREMFLNICDNEDFEGFKEITGLDSAFFEGFKEELLNVLQNLEEDYPGICEQYYESPCEDCSRRALQRVGQVVHNYNGNSAVAIDRLDPRDCLFICSMACMSLAEAYIPCVLACTELCIRLNSLHS